MPNVIKGFQSTDWLGSVRVLRPNKSNVGEELDYGTDFLDPL